MSTRRPDIAPRTPQKEQQHDKDHCILSHKPQHRIGPYVVSKTLGIGSTGHVKLGTHFQTQATVAIKFIPKPPLAVQDKKQLQLKRKLEREITIMKIIKHPNVLQLMDVYETDTELLLVLEHVQGGELFDYIVQRGRLAESEALSFFQQIISGVDFFHRHMICRVSTLPDPSQQIENLLIDQHLNIKIADFGMANSQSYGRMLETSCGSPHYASPEIIKGVQYNGNESDIWSCGIILYALLTGNLPFDDENIRLLGKVKAGLFIIPSYVNPDAQFLIRQMLTVDAVYRITMREVLEDPWFNSQINRTREDEKFSSTEYVDAPEPITNIDSALVEQLHAIGYTADETLQAIQAEGRCIEKVIYRSLLDNKNRSAVKASEDESHRLPESPKRRSQYQKDQIDELSKSQMPTVAQLASRAMSGTFFRGGKQDSSVTMHNEQHQSTHTNSDIDQVIDQAISHSKLAQLDTKMYETPERCQSIQQSPSKKSWFNALFHNRSNTHTIRMYKPAHYSLIDLQATCNVRLTSKLLIKQRLKIRYQSVAANDKAVIKCKHNVEDDATLVCKFRIDISVDRALITYQHGNHELFEKCVRDIDELMG